MERGKPKVRSYVLTVIKHGSDFRLSLGRNLSVANCECELPLHRVIFGTGNPIATLEQRLRHVWQRKNSVCVMAVHINSQLQGLNQWNDGEKHNWEKHWIDFLKGEFGENFISADIWVTESNIKIRALVTPIVNGRLNARHFVGSPVKLASLQERAALAMTCTPVTPQKAAVTNELRLSLVRETDDLRALPLDGVLEQLGFAKSLRDKKRWVDPKGKHAITIAGNKWYCHKAHVGSLGAIDLVSEILVYDFQAAREWLLGRPISSRASQPIVLEATDAKAVQFTPPSRSDVHWPAVKAYLTRIRGLDETLIDQLHIEGKVYADAMTNAVFLALDTNGNPVSAELRGTLPGSQFKGLSQGSRKGEHFFSIGAADAKKVYFFESAIDALSLLSLATLLGRPADLRQRRYVSTAGVKSAPPAWDPEVEVICCYDNDQAGEKSSLKWPKRYRPTAKDWNEALLSRRRENSTRLSHFSFPEAD